MSALDKRFLIIPIVIAAAVFPCRSLADDSPAISGAISNVRAEQREGTGFVDIWYDASADFADVYAVDIEISDNDGKTYEVAAVSLSGDIGESVVPGDEKHIVWDAEADWRNGVSEQMRVRITGALCHSFGASVSPPTNPAPEVVEIFSSWPVGEEMVETSVGTWNIQNCARIWAETARQETNVVSKEFGYATSGSVASSVVPGFTMISVLFQAGTVVFYDDGNGNLKSSRYGDGLIRYESGVWGLPPLSSAMSEFGHIRSVTVKFACVQSVPVGELSLYLPEERPVCLASEEFTEFVFTGILDKHPVVPGSVSVVVHAENGTEVFTDNGDGGLVSPSVDEVGVVFYDSGLWRIPVWQIENTFGQVSSTSVVYLWDNPDEIPVQLQFPSLTSTLVECRVFAESLDSRAATLRLLSSETDAVLDEATFETGTGLTQVVLVPSEQAGRYGIGCVSGTLRVHRLELWTLPASVSAVSAAFVIDTHLSGTWGHTATTPEPVPYAWLRGYYPAILDEYEAYEAAANATAANGRPVWECYVAGLDPTDATDDFFATIEMVDGEPQISVGGRGERPGRVYTVEGKENLGDSWGPTNAMSRFFHITVEVE